MIRNLTPHKLTIYDNKENIILEVKSEGQARVNEESTQRYTFNNIPVVSKKYKSADLPEYEQDTILIVSKIVLDAHQKRHDLLCPDTGPDSVVRSEDGKILGVKRLQCK